MIWRYYFSYGLKAWLVVFLLAQPLWGASDQDTVDAVPKSALEFAQESTVSLEDLALFLVPLTASELSMVAKVWQDHLHAELESRMHAELNLRTATGDFADLLRSSITEIGRAHV